MIRKSKFPFVGVFILTCRGRCPHRPETKSDLDGPILFKYAGNEKYFAHRGQKYFRADVGIRPYDLIDKWQFDIFKE